MLLDRFMTGVIRVFDFGYSALKTAKIRRLAVTVA
jgi:hypothetical protein